MAGVAVERNPDVDPGLIFAAGAGVEVTVEQGEPARARIGFDEETDAVANGLRPGGWIDGEGGLEVRVRGDAGLEGDVGRWVHVEPSALDAANPFELPVQEWWEECRASASGGAGVRAPGAEGADDVSHDVSG